MKQISALEKVRPYDELNCREIFSRTVMQGERFSYQVIVKIDDRNSFARLRAESDFGDAVKLFVAKDVFVDTPAYAETDLINENYLIKEPGFLPDVLVPLEEQGGLISCMARKNVCIWVRVDIPKDAAPGKYSVKLHFEAMSADVVKEHTEKELVIEVAPVQIPEQRLVYTRWFYADCIADYYNVEPYSEAHWSLIDSYIERAADIGINMILVPVHTPPLDTEVRTRRTCVQLVDIAKIGDTYEFDFSKFHRFIAICKKHGIKFFEIAHMFSQWGSKCAPNIMVTENGKKEYKFGWHVPADSEEYRGFLKQYIKAISDALNEEGISENAYFHISDEPNLTNADKYEIAYNITKPLIGNSKTMDALSHVEFYDKGFVQSPVTIVNEAHTFIDHKVKDLWVYYCCISQKVYPNSFLAMPLARVRILGFLLYKYDIKGFLHWGYNFYNAEKSVYRIDPYLTTSAEGAYPSGDAYVVYPSKKGAYSSMRAETMYDAIQDMNTCFALEERIGRDAVVRMIDDAAGRDLRFDDYPCTNEFLEELRARMLKAISD